MLAGLFGFSANAEVIDNGPSVDNGPKRGPSVTPSPKTNPGIPYDADHRCDNCGHQSAAGTGTWVVHGAAPGGAHTHKCPKCGQVWQHGGSGPTAHKHDETPMQYTLPGSLSGCANGQCPTSSTVRRGIFRR